MSSRDSFHRGHFFMVHYSDEEIEKIRELRRLGFFQKTKQTPTVGSMIYSKDNVPGCSSLKSHLHIICDPQNDMSSFFWLPNFDELLKLAKEREISFSQISDFIHRRRFADGREREGLLLLLVETSR